jgi:hypothetical protein
LIVDAGDSGVTREYAGTLFNGQSSSSTNGLAVANSFGQSSTISYTGQTTQNAFAVATPMYHYSRQTTFSAKLVDPTTGRNLSIGNGQINAGGRFFVGDGTSGGSSAAAIFSDLQSKGIISRSS